MWAFAIKSKLTAAVLLCGVIGVVIITNFSERSSNTRINTAVASIYEDRLVVEGYIFKYAQALQYIVDIINDASLSANQKKTIITKKLNELDKLHALYASTKLTTEEETGFNTFKHLCGLMLANAHKANLAEIPIVVKQAEAILNTLSSIQMAEAKTQMESVHKISSFSNIVSQLELVILIVIAVLIQILIFSSRTIAKAKVPDNIHLN